jgi:hypothetical protein
VGETQPAAGDRGGVPGGPRGPWRAGIAVGPRLATEVQDLAQKLPETSKRIQNGEIVVGLVARGGWESQQIREIDRLVQSHMGEIVGYAQQATTSVLK